MQIALRINKALFRRLEHFGPPRAADNNMIALKQGGQDAGQNIF